MLNVRVIADVGNNNIVDDVRIHNRSYNYLSKYSGTWNYYEVIKLVND